MREYAPGEIVLRKDDYGTSAFLVLEGGVDVVIRPDIDPQLLGRARSVKKSFIARLAQGAEVHEKILADHAHDLPNRVAGLEREPVAVALDQRQRHLGGQRLRSRSRRYPDLR